MLRWGDKHEERGRGHDHDGVDAQPGLAPTRRVGELADHGSEQRHHDARNQQCGAEAGRGHCFGSERFARQVDRKHKGRHHRIERGGSPVPERPGEHGALLDRHDFGGGSGRIRRVNAALARGIAHGGHTSRCEERTGSAAGRVVDPSRAIASGSGTVCPLGPQGRTRPRVRAPHRWSDGCVPRRRIAHETSRSQFHVSRLLLRARGAPACRAGCLDLPF